MILYKVCYEACFESNEDIVTMEQKHNIKIINVTQYYIENRKREGKEYRGNPMYLFIGDWPNLVKYFIWDYYLEDIEQLKDLIVDMKTIEFNEF